MLFCIRGLDTLFCITMLWIGRNTLKLSTNVYRHLGSHPSLYRIFAHRSHLGKMCGTTLKAVSTHNPPETYSQSTSVPQQTLYTVLVFQALKRSFSSDIDSPLSWLDAMLEPHTEAYKMTMWTRICYANFLVRKSPRYCHLPSNPNITQWFLIAVELELTVLT